MDPPVRREIMIHDADDRSTKVTNQFRRGMLTYNEMTAGAQPQGEFSI